MCSRLSKVRSTDSGPFWQFVKYGTIGVLSTLVQALFFYLLASTCLRCLGGDDWAVRFLSLPDASVSDAVRAQRFAIATALAFVISNIFCWLMNRRFVFRAGKYFWALELLMFISVSGLAMALATGISWLLINKLGTMTTIAVFVEVVVSFVFNYFIRKFVIFRG